MTQLSLQNVSKSFGKTSVIRGLDLDVVSGEFIVLVGPSGCGKSTVLRMIAGLEDLTAGEVRLNGRVVNSLSPKERGVAMVFQNYALYPHMSVRQNISFGLKLSKMAAQEIDLRVSEAARTLNLSDYLDKKPGQLSGGQKQRVAMGRAMVRRPQLFLFDEPLSNLDAALRVRMRAEIAQLHKRLGCTTVYVTHDQVEAMTLADRIAVVNGGKIEQLGAPLDLYNAPETKFVASFLGMPPMNFLPSAMIPVRQSPHGAVEVGFRAEDSLLAHDERLKEASAQSGVGTGLINIPGGAVKLVEPLGGISHIHVQLSGGAEVVAETRMKVLPKIGDVVDILVDGSKLHFFDASGKTLSPSGDRQPRRPSTTAES